MWRWRLESLAKKGFNALEIFVQNIFFVKNSEGRDAITAFVGP
jgi:hypothetical protein